MVIDTGGMSMNNLKALLFSIFASSNTYTIPKANNILSKNINTIITVLNILFGFTGFLNGFSIFYNAGRIIHYRK